MTTWPCVHSTIMFPRWSPWPKNHEHGACSDVGCLWCLFGCWLFMVPVRMLVVYGACSDVACSWCLFGCWLFMVPVRMLVVHGACSDVGCLWCLFGCWLFMISCSDVGCLWCLFGCWLFMVPVRMLLVHGACSDVACLWCLFGCWLFMVPVRMLVVHGACSDVGCLCWNMNLSVSTAVPSSLCEYYNTSLLAYTCTGGSCYNTFLTSRFNKISPRQAVRLIQANKPVINP